jgi:hypothetical protein
VSSTNIHSSVSRTFLLSGILIFLISYVPLIARAFGSAWKNVKYYCNWTPLPGWLWLKNWEKKYFVLIQALAFLNNIWIQPHSLDTKLNSFKTWFTQPHSTHVIISHKILNTPVFSGVHVARSLVLYVCFADCCLSFCLLGFFFFGHCVVCSSSINGFWLSLWYLQTLHIYTKHRRLNSLRKRIYDDRISCSSFLLVFLDIQTQRSIYWIQYPILISPFFRYQHKTRPPNIWM